MMQICFQRPKRLEEEKKEGKGEVEIQVEGRDIPSTIPPPPRLLLIRWINPMLTKMSSKKNPRRLRRPWICNAYRHGEVAEQSLSGCSEQRRMATWELQQNTRKLMKKMGLEDALDEGKEEGNSKS